MCHQGIKELVLALLSAVTSSDPAWQLIFSPLMLNLEFDWRIISVKGAGSQAPHICMGHVPTATRLCHEPCSWKI